MVQDVDALVALAGPNNCARLAKAIALRDVGSFQEVLKDPPAPANTSALARFAMIALISEGRVKKTIIKTRQKVFWGVVENFRFNDDSQAYEAIQRLYAGNSPIARMFKIATLVMQGHQGNMIGNSHSPVYLKTDGVDRLSLIIGDPGKKTSPSFAIA